MRAAAKKAEASLAKVQALDMAYAPAEGRMGEAETDEQAESEDGEALQEYRLSLDAEWQFAQASAEELRDRQCCSTAALGRVHMTIEDV